MKSHASYPYRDLSEFVPGVERERTFGITGADLARFAEVSQDQHPLHRVPVFSRERGYPDVLAHGMLVASRCSAFVASEFVGSHGLLVSFAADFRQPVFCDEELIWRGTVTQVSPEDGTVEVSWRVLNDCGHLVQRGTACATVPNSR